MIQGLLRSFPVQYDTLPDHQRDMEKRETAPENQHEDHCWVLKALCDAGYYGVGVARTPEHNLGCCPLLPLFPPAAHGAHAARAALSCPSCPFRSCFSLPPMLDLLHILPLLVLLHVLLTAAICWPCDCIDTSASDTPNLLNLLSGVAGIHAWHGKQKGGGGDQLSASLLLLDFMKKWKQ